MFGHVNYEQMTATNNFLFVEMTTSGYELLGGVKNPEKPRGYAAGFGFLTRGGYVDSACFGLN